MFDREFQSSVSAKKEGLKPVYSIGNMLRVTDKVVAFCDAQGFVDVIRNDTFHEISANCPPFQLTFILVSDDRGTVCISILASTNKLGGGCKKLIISLNHELEEFLGNSVRKE